MAQLARAAGFPDGQVAVAVAIALAESSGHPAATNHNTNGSFDFGLWQINTVHGALLTTGAWCVPADNAAMAHTVWTRAGGSWTPWSTYNSGLPHPPRRREPGGPGAGRTHGTRAQHDPNRSARRGTGTGTIRQPHPDGNTHPSDSPTPSQTPTPTASPPPARPRQLP